MLYGLPIVDRRTIGVGKVDPDLAREMFIRHALVAGDWETRHEFVANNQKYLKSTVATWDEDASMPQITYQDVDTSLIPPRPRLYGLVGAESVNGSGLLRR